MGCLISREDVSKIESHGTRRRNSRPVGKKTRRSSRLTEIQEFKGVPSGLTFSDGLSDSIRKSPGKQLGRRQRRTKSKNNGNQQAQGMENVSKDISAVLRHTRARRIRHIAEPLEGFSYRPLMNRSQRHTNSNTIPSSSLPHLVPEKVMPVSNEDGAGPSHLLASTRFANAASYGIPNQYREVPQQLTNVLHKNMFHERQPAHSTSTGGNETSSMQFSNQTDDSSHGKVNVSSSAAVSLKNKSDAFDYEIISTEKLIEMHEWLDQLLSCMARTPPQDPQLLANTRRGGVVSNVVSASGTGHSNATSSPSTMPQVVSISEKSSLCSLRENSGDKVNPSLSDPLRA